MKLFQRKTKSPSIAVVNLKAFQDRFDTGPVKMFSEHECPHWITKVSKILAPFTNCSHEYWQSHLMTEHSHATINQFQKGFNQAMKTIEETKGPVLLPSFRILSQKRDLRTELSWL